MIERVRGVLLTGSSGYVGGRVADRIRSDPHFELFQLNRSKSGARNSYLLVSREASIEGSLEEIALSLAGQKIDVVINCAGSVLKGHSPDQVQNLVEANLLFPSILISSLANQRVHFIQLGTFSFRDKGRTFFPQSFYSASKRSVEDLLWFFFIREGVSVTVLHLYDIYGPGQPHQRLIPTIVKKLRLGETIETSKGEQEIAPVYIDDVVDSLIVEAEKDLSDAQYRTFDLHGPDVIRVAEVPAIISKALDLELGETQHRRSIPYAGNEIFEFSTCHDNPYLSRLTRFEEGLRISFADPTRR